MRVAGSPRAAVFLKRARSRGCEFDFLGDELVITHEFGPLAVAIAKMFTIQKLATVEPYDEKVQPAGLAQTTTLYPFQRQALAWMRSREEQEPHGGLLADEMGVGKTVEVIALILDNPRTVLGGPCIGATLIVTPSTILPQWRSELALHSPGLKVCVFNGSDKSDESVARLSGYDVVLVSYDVLKKEVHRAAAHKAASSGCRSSLRFAHLPLRPAAKCIMMEIDWWRIVLDEVQYAKAGRNAGKMVRMPLLSTAGRCRAHLCATDTQATCFSCLTLSVEAIGLMRIGLLESMRSIRPPPAVRRQRLSSSSLRPCSCGERRRLLTFNS